MSNPPDPTNLSQKFAALQQLMTTQHNALMAEITALRGVGPENTLRSVNQSLWNLAGAAPGATLGQLKAAIEALAGGKSLAALWNLWTPGAGTPYALLESSDTTLQQLKTLWSPQGEGYSAYDLLNNLYQAILANGLTETDAKAILARIIAQLDTGTVTPTVKDLLMTMSNQQAQIAANTASPFDSPVGCCETPVRSTGTSYVTISGNIIEPFTAATWPETIGGDFVTSYTVGTLSYSAIHCTDWTQYKIYVASEATDWGIFGPSPQRQPTNQWLPGTVITNNPHFLIAQDINFIVQGSMRLDVYICPVSTPPSGPGLAQIGWNYNGTYSNPSVSTIVNKVYTPVFTTASTATIGGHTIKFATNADGRYIMMGRDQTLNLSLTWTDTVNSPLLIHNRNRLIGTQGQFVALDNEPWHAGQTGPVQAAISPASIGTLNFTADDSPVEFVYFTDFYSPAPTALNFSLVAEV
jgi:hypothetical protein